VGIVVAGGLVVVVGGTVDGGVLTGAGRVVVVVGSVVVVGGAFRTGLVLVVVVGRLVVVGRVSVVRCRPGRGDEGALPPGAEVCLFGWEWWGAVDAPTVRTGPRFGGLPAGACDRDDRDEIEEVSERRSAVTEVNTGTPAPVERLGISGRVAPT
jgi:hypothetical protein